MCRFLVYIGRKKPIVMADLVTRPNHSIIHQSLECRERANGPVNGDGFGVGWYSDVADDSTQAEYTSTIDSTTPCIFTCTNPAWSNINLRRLAEKIKSPLIFAHVRAATPGVSITEANCHPFQYKQFMWMHNGNLEGFSKIKRRIVQHLPEELFNHIQGTTDSEWSFMLFLYILLFRDKEAITSSEGQKKNTSDTCPAQSTAYYSDDYEFPDSAAKPPPQSYANTNAYASFTAKPSATASSIPEKIAPEKLKAAMIETIRLLKEWTQAAGVTEPSYLNFAVTDGYTVVVTRYITDPSGPLPASLYYASGSRYERVPGKDGEYQMVQSRQQLCYIIASEPLSNDVKDWVPVPPNSLIVVTPKANLLIYPIDV